MEFVVLLASIVSIVLTVFVPIAIGKFFSSERSLRQLASPHAGGLLGMVNQIAVNTSPTLLPALIAIELNTRPKNS
jgi:putative exporter of polyketide antibiotics